MRCGCNILVRKPEVNRPLGRSGRRWKIIVEWILRKYGGSLWTGCIWFRIEVIGGLL
jgi:hypothetical protein